MASQMRYEGEITDELISSLADDIANTDSPEEALKAYERLEKAIEEKRRRNRNKEKNEKVNWIKFIYTLNGEEKEEIVNLDNCYKGSLTYGDIDNYTKEFLKQNPHIIKENLHTVEIDI